MKGKKSIHKIKLNPTITSTHIAPGDRSQADSEKGKSMTSCDRNSGIEHRFGRSINRTLQGRYKAVRNVFIEGIVKSRRK